MTEIRAEIRDFRQATIASFNAQREDINDLRQQMNKRFVEVDKGFTEVRGKLDAQAAGQKQVVNLLNTLISQHGGSSDER